MSTTQELIERLKTYRAYCPQTDRSDHPICNEAAKRLAALAAELAALKAKLAGVDEKGLEVAEAAGLAAFRKSGTQRDALRAAIAAYLAVVRDAG